MSQVAKPTDICSCGAQDFHSAVEGALSDEDYVSELYEAMLEEGREALERGMELAAQRAVRKAEVKVHVLPHLGINLVVWDL